MYSDIVPTRKVNPSEKDSELACAYTFLTRVSDDEEKNIILLRLLEYLGHPNPYICAVAYNEVRC